MDIFKVDEIMRYGALQKEWDATTDETQQTAGHQAEGKTDHNTEDKPQTPATTPRTIDSKAIDTLRRGQKLEFIYGERVWRAVYWGKDNDGHVIAHKTFKEWALTRLDLHQYVGKLLAESEPDRDLLRDIEQSLCKR